MSGRPRRLNSLGLKVTVFAIGLLCVPLPAPTASAFNTGQAVTQFYECTDPNWQQCRTGNVLDNVSAVRSGITSNEESTRYGFKFPVQGVASSIDLDVQGDHGYRTRTSLQNNQGAWNQPTALFQNTTSLFGLRTDLDTSSPFFPNTGNNANTSFTTGVANYDVASGDFNSDGKDDLAVLAGNTLQIRRFSGGNWLNSTNYTLSTGVPMGVKAVDLNLDGRMDAVVLTNVSGSAYWYAYVQNPWGGAHLEGPVFMVGGGLSTLPWDFDVGDLTGDGYPEIATVLPNRTVYWWSQFSGNNLDFWGANNYSVRFQTLQYGNRATFLAAAPAPCTSWVAQANIDNNIYVYYQTNLTTVATLTAHSNSVNGLAWSPNCQYLASAGADNTVLLWRTSNWTVAANLTNHTNAVYGLAFSPDSANLASWGADKTIKVWNLSTMPPTLDFDLADNNGTVFSLAYSPNGTYLVAGTGNSTVRVRSTVDYSLVANLTGHSLAIHSVAFSPDGLTLASGSDDDKMLVWDMVNLTKTLERTQAGADVYRVVFSPNGTRLLAASLDSHIRIYRTSDYALTDDVVEGSFFVYAADFERTGQFFFTGSTANYVRLWDKSVLTSIGRVQTGQEFSILSVAYAPDSRLAAGAEDGTVLVRWGDNGTLIKQIRAHNGTVNRVAWSPDGSLLASSGSDGVVHVWNSSTWAYAANLTILGNVTSLDFSDAGNRLAAASSTGAIAVWSASGFSVVANLTAPSAVNSLAFDPAGGQLVSAGSDAVVHVWNIASAWNFQNLTGPTAGLKAVDWSPDGSQVAAAGLDRRTRSWWTSNWTLNSNVAPHTGDIWALAFAPDSSRFATGGLDGRLYTYGRNGAVLQSYSVAPAGSSLLLSIAWTPDSTRIAAGWQDNRFASLTFQGCPVNVCIASEQAYGIAIGQADNTAGNDLVVVGAYHTTWQPDSGVWRLGFSGGVPYAWSNITWNAPSPVNAVPDGYRIALGDLNGDGKNDIAVAADTDGTGSLYLISWNTTCSCYDGGSIVSLPIGGSVDEIIIADVTDDGHNDVVIATGNNQLQVAYWEANARTLGQFKIANVSKYAAPASGSIRMGIAVGNFSNDTLPDVATTSGVSPLSYIFRQKDQLFGTYVSAPIVDLAFVGDPIVSASMWWDDYNVVANVTTFNASVTFDGGFTWFPAGENQTVNLNGSNTSSIQYKFDFWSSHAAVTAWVLSVNVDYLVETTPTNVSLDFARDFQPANGDCYFPGVALGLFHCTVPASVVNRYVLDNWGQQDANGSVYIPIRIKWERPATIQLTNLSIPYNAWSSAPALVWPAAGVFVDATPSFVVNAADTDGDTLRYHIQISTDPLFATVARDYDANLSTAGWERPLFLAGLDANFTMPDADRLANGQKYWWRATAFDGLQWSAWSVPQNFTVDDLPPEGQATSPGFSTVESFIVSWSAVDPAGGAGLAAAPFDVQVKDGLDGPWTDFKISESATSATFNGLNGHTYCFRMRAADAAGNQQLYISSTAGDTCTTIDTDRPTASLLDLPPFEQTRNFEVRWTGDDGPSGSGIAGYSVEVMPEGGAWSTWLSNFAGDHGIYTAAADRLYSFRVSARDRAGNLGDPSAAGSTRVDTTPPTCRVSVPGGTSTSLENLAVSFSCSDPETSVAALEYCVGTGPGLCDVLLPQRVTSPVSVISGLSLANGGTYHISVHGENGAGTWSPWVASSPVRVVIPGPSAHIEYLDGVWTSTDLNVTFGASDNLGYPIVAGELQYRRAPFRYNALGTWEDWLTVALPPDQVTYHFDSASVIRGYAYEFQYRARNSVGSWGDRATGGTLYVNQLPVASAGADRVANLSEPVLLDGSASLDYDGARDALTYTWEIDDGRTFPGSTATVTFTQPGTHRATLKVSDGHENATATVYVYVPPAAPRQVAPGFDGLVLLAALIGVAVVLGAGRKARSG